MADTTYIQNLLNLGFSHEQVTQIVTSAPAATSEAAPAATEPATETAPEPEPEPEPEKLNYQNELRAEVAEFCAGTGASPSDWWISFNAAKKVVSEYEKRDEKRGRKPKAVKAAEAVVKAARAVIDKAKAKAAEKKAA